MATAVEYGEGIPVTLLPSLSRPRRRYTQRRASVSRRLQATRHSSECTLVTPVFWDSYRHLLAQNGTSGFLTVRVHKRGSPVARWDTRVGLIPASLHGNDNVREQGPNDRCCVSAAVKFGWVSVSLLPWCRSSAGSSSLNSHLHIQAAHDDTVWCWRTSAPALPAHAAH